MVKLPNCLYRYRRKYTGKGDEIVKTLHAKIGFKDFFCVQYYVKK